MSVFLYSLISISVLIFSHTDTYPSVHFDKSVSLQSFKTKLSLADTSEWTGYFISDTNDRGIYSFGYDIEDYETGNIQFRTEERLANGTVTGNYGFVTPEGSVHVVHYIADQFGYRTRIEDVKKIKLSQENFKTLDKSQQNISPQMISALQSLRNYKLFQKGDENDHL